jgi:hypothetical protein
MVTMSPSRKESIGIDPERADVQRFGRGNRE